MATTNADGTLASGAAPSGFAPPARVTKTATETVTNSIVLQNDDELLLPVLANRIYDVVALLRAQSPGGAGGDPGLAIDFAIPAGAALGIRRWPSEQMQVPSLGPIPNLGANGWPVGIPLPVAAGPGFYVGAILAVGATPGNLQLRWAQAIAEAGNVQLLAGSVLLATPLN